MEIFRSITDEDVAQSIRSASKRVVFVAPGVSAVVSDALIACMKNRKVKPIMIVLDANEESCRLGYCDAPSLGRLTAAATEEELTLRRQAGIRIGLLMADDEVLIWTPTPLMFEAPRGVEEPNGLSLTTRTLECLPEALGVDPEEPANFAEIGLVELKTEEVEKVVAAIKAAPPAPFDLSRLTRVFSVRFQFIETVLRGAELTKREMRLDSMILNSDAPEELRPLLHTTVQPFNTDSDKVVDVQVLVNGELAYHKDGEILTRPTTQAEIRSYWDELTNRYIINLPGFGKIIRHTDKIKFEECKVAFESVLRAWVNGFQEKVKGEHDQRVNRVVTLIAERMKRAGGKKKPTLQQDQIRELVQKGLDNLRVIEPNVKVLYKNITVESTRDKEFLDVLQKALPTNELKEWFHIFNAAPMIQLGAKALLE
jgi:hypothetical protein